MTTVVFDSLRYARRLREAAGPAPRSRRSRLLCSWNWDGLVSIRACVSTEIEEAWAQEIEQRVAAFDRGEIQTFTAEAVFADAKRI